MTAVGRAAAAVARTIRRLLAPAPTTSSDVSQLDAWDRRAEAERFQRTLLDQGFDPEHVDQAVANYGDWLRRKAAGDHNRAYSAAVTR